MAPMSSKDKPKDQQASPSVFRQAEDPVFAAPWEGQAFAAAVVLRDVSTAFGPRWPASVAAIVAALFLFWTHRSNIRKALGGGAGASEVSA